VKVFVTGATGFVGRALVEDLLSKSYEVKALVRQYSETLPLAVEQVVVGDLADFNLANCEGLLRKALADIDIIVHVAARVHIMKDNVFEPLVQFRKVNRDATLVLASLAADAGIKRFVFLSSIKVNGENTKPDKYFTPDDINIPSDPYGLSKYEAEQGLLALAKKTELEVVIIRPPLIYGPGVKGNFNTMIKWMNMPLPLPFGAIHNRRSFVALDNLVNLVCLCVDREKSHKASNQVLLISDGKDISTTQLLEKVRQVLNCGSHSVTKAWLVPVPECILIFFAKALGKADMSKRLFGSLQVDSSKTHELLGWKPVVNMDEQLAKMSKDF
jgi:nucleoside-diphosphate-sugar epimerase